MLIISAILALIAAFLIVWAIVTYNTFITLQERVNNGMAQIATQLESRWDAIKSLISATKNYSQYEAETLEVITEKRVSIGRNSSITEIENDGAQLDNVIGRLLAVSENYPDLKASDVYQSSMESINKFEDNVRGARMIYNDVVTRFNRQVKMFPSSIIANIFHFKVKEYFQVTESKEEMPNWD